MFVEAEKSSGDYEREDSEGSGMLNYISAPLFQPANAIGTRSPDLT